MNESEQRHPTHDWRQFSRDLDTARSTLQAADATQTTFATTGAAIPPASPRIVPVRAPKLAQPATRASSSSSGTEIAFSRVDYRHSSQPLPAPESAEQDLHARDAAHSDATVLIVEHEFTNRVLMEKILDIGGYRCLTATNGMEALAIFERERPDLILTDISMPVMDGLAATAAVRARPDGLHVPIIAVSGHALRQDREHALRQGCTEYLVKPYRPHDLLTMVERLLRDRGGQV